METNYTVLVIGCLKHEEIADRYFKLANIYWNDSLKNTIFCTDQITNYQRSFSPTIVSETISSFANRILSGIELIETDYVILLLDDYYLTKKINQEALKNLILYMRKANIEYCKLVGMPKCFSKNKEYHGTFHIKKQTHYGVSLQPSVWKKTALVEALNNCNGNSAWEVEAAFSIYQKNNYKKCLTFNKNFLHYHNGVLRGKLFPYTNKLLRKNNIDPLEIEAVSRFQSFVFMTRQRLSMHLPIWLRKIGKKIGMKKGKKYYSAD